MGKVLVSLVMMWFMVVMMDSAYAETFQEALNRVITAASAINYSKDGDYISIRTNLENVLTLATTEEEKNQVQFYKMMTYVWAQDNVNAVTECTIIINKADTALVDKMLAYFYRGLSYWRQNDARAKDDFIKIIIDGEPSYKIEAYKKIIESGLDLIPIISALENVKDWAGYYCRAKIKENSKDWQGALNDYHDAFKLRPEDKSADKQILEALKAVEALLK